MLDVVVVIFLFFCFFVLLPIIITIIITNEKVVNITSSPRHVRKITFFGTKRDKYRGHWGEAVMEVDEAEDVEVEVLVVDPDVEYLEKESVPF